MIAQSAARQKAIDAKNAEFWDELCGSQMARALGITDNSPESLKKFDAWYFGFYPYLYNHIPFATMRGKRVLEVGLGYGTIAQKIAESGANYHGIDIAEGPVAMAAHRCQLVCSGDALVLRASILEPPFEYGMFDWVVAIGCLHHTGDLARAIRNVHGLLRSGGEAVIMVYSAASYRQFTAAPITTIKRLIGAPYKSYRLLLTDEDERRAYDTDAKGEAAPQTEFVTKTELKQLCSDFAEVSIQSENIGSEGVFRYLPRSILCKWLGPIVGLDHYCRLVK